MTVLGAMLFAACCASAADETARWQQAIDAAGQRGGGRVVIPAGTHEVGQLELRSGVELHLAKGAILSGLPDIKHYRVVELPFSEGRWSAVVFAIGVENVAVTGEGEITGNGGLWPQPMSYGGNQEGLRPRGMFFANSRNIRLEDFTFRDAACWGIVFKCCDGVVARHVTVDSHANANNDGFDIEAKNVLIEDCDVDSGDDAYCLKSNTPDFAVENVRIRRCIARSHCGAFKLGTASHGTMRNICVEHCRSEAPRRDFLDRRTASKRYGKPWFLHAGYEYLPAGVGIVGIAVECVDGGIVENITFDDIELAGSRVPIFVCGGTRSGRACGTPPNTHYILRNVSIQNIRGRGESAIASVVIGADGCRPRNVSLSHIALSVRAADAKASQDALTRPVPDRAKAYPEVTAYNHIFPAYGLYVDRADNVALDDVHFTRRPGGEDGRPEICRTGR